MYFIDVQGTLIDDDKRLPIDGAVEFIDYLNAYKIPYVVITNNTKHTSEEFLEYLNSIGLHIPSRCYIDPFSILLQETKPTTVAAFGQQSFINILENFGFVLDYENPKALIISIKQDFTNEDYAQMIKFALMGAKIIGMHETSIYAKDKKQYPGVGAILKMISFATNRDYSVVGKPSVNFYEKAKNLLGATNYEEITIISDDMMGDIIGAQELGMQSIFVLSGKIKEANQVLDTLEKKKHPTHIYENIGAYLKDLI